MHLMTTEKATDAFQPQWLAYATEWFTTDADPDAPQVVIQLITHDTAAVVEVAEGTVKARVGHTTNADLTIEGPPRSVLGLVTGVFGAEYADQMGLKLTGRRKVLTRLRPLTAAAGLGQGEQAG